MSVYFPCFRFHFFLQELRVFVFFLISVLVKVYQRIVFLCKIEFKSCVFLLFLVSVLVKVFQSIVFFFCKIELKSCVFLCFFSR
jgi:hypothetical protein